MKEIEQRHTAMKFGGWVNCTKFVRRTGNHYMVIPALDAPAGVEEAVYYGEDAPADGLEIEDEHSCQQYKTVEKRFSGIFVGTTTLSTELECSYEEPPYGRSGYRFRKSKPQEFAIVYYAGNKKRLVPLDSIQEAAE